MGELNHARSPLGWLVWLVLMILLDVSYKRGKPDLNILFQYNMPDVYKRQVLHDL